MPTGKSSLKFKKSHLVSAGVGVFVMVSILIWSTDVTRFENVRAHYTPSDVWIVDRKGYPLESIRTHKEKRNLDWTRWSEVSPAFRNLLVQVEDRRFYIHPGVDLIALAKASWDRLVKGSRRGASTLTMQLIGLLKDDSINQINQRRSILQKLKQMILALKLEAQWTKEQILEAYINLVPFRGELVGLRAASFGYFGKDPSGLVENEAALLVALLRSPNASPELVAQRACFALGTNANGTSTLGTSPNGVSANGTRNCREIRAFAAQVLSKPYQLTRSRKLVPVLAKSFIKESSDVIKTSLDYRIQELAMQTLQEQLRSLKNQNVSDGAVLILETQSGQVLAYIANSGTGSASAAQIDGIQMRRQAGSTIKPFVYATAFDWNLLRPTSLLEDSPTNISIANGFIYNPQNYDHVFRGLVSVGEALGSSLNIPAVRVLQMVSESRVLDRLRALGFEQRQEDEFYGPSLALGAIDVSLWELAQGYRQFAIDSSPFSRQTRLSIFNILASPEYRRFTFGMDSLLALPFPAAVKTGTSKDMRDNWCIGWTSQYTIGVWVGNFNGEPMWNVSGMSGAAPVWRAMMLALHQSSLQHNLTKTKYEETGRPLLQRTISRIRYPVPNMLVGIDPDIPPSLQKLPIEIENPRQGQKIFLNSRVLGRVQKTILWPLQRGKYQITLKNQLDEELDSVNIEVR